MEKIVEYCLIAKATRDANGKVVQGSAKINGIIFPTTYQRGGANKGKEDLANISALNLGVKWLKIPHDAPEDILDLNEADKETLAQFTPDYAELSFATAPDYLPPEKAEIFKALLAEAIQAKKDEKLRKQLDEYDALKAKLEQLEALKKQLGI